MNQARLWWAGMAAMLLALVLMVLQHWGMMLSVSDDPWIVQLGYDAGVMQGAMDVAIKQGRVGYLVVMNIAQWPYLFDNWMVVNAIKIAINALVFISFVLFCSKLTNKYIAVLIGLVWLALIDINSSNYSPIHGFLLLFNLQEFFFFMSLWLFMVKLERNAPSTLIISPYLLFGFSLLAYESMIFNALAFPALYLYKQVQNPEVRNRSIWLHAKLYLKQNYALLVVVFLFLLAYIGFRKIYGAGGNALDMNAGWHEIIKTIVNFSIYGFHAKLTLFGSGVLEQFTLLNVALAVIFAGAIVLAMYFVVPLIEGNMSERNLNNKIPLAFLLFFILSPNILYGFMDAYRKWANYDPHYGGNYFSSFPLAIAITLAVLYLVGGNKSRQERLLFILVLYVFFSSACDNYLRWERLAVTNRQESAMWVKAIAELQQKNLDVTRSTLICGVNAPRHVSGDDKYWSQYLSRKLSADVQYVSNRVSVASCGVIVDFQKYIPDSRGG